ncbi:MAG: hypothetical protein CM1200mP4_3640 [Rhodospirillaceae bacterium]|nr:MAG: hypothetical protein CM1200mP4_3640 [Rhodospirillaceae bacterium]
MTLKINPNQDSHYNFSGPGNVGVWLTEKGGGEGTQMAEKKIGIGGSAGRMGSALVREIEKSEGVKLVAAMKVLLIPLARMQA